MPGKRYRAPLPRIAKIARRTVRKLLAPALDDGQLLAYAGMATAVKT